MNERGDGFKHPDAERLGCYLDGELPETEADEIRRHLLDCPECAAFVLDLAEFSEIDPGVSDLLTPAQQAADRHRLMSAISAPGASGRRPAPARVDRRWRIAAVVAAAIAVSSWLWVLLAPPPAPGARSVATDVFLAANLRPGDTDRRGEAIPPDEPQAVQVPAWAQQVHLLLNVGRLHDHPAFRVEISGNGETVWAGAVQRNPAGNFGLVVPRELLADGPYEIRLLGETADGDLEALAVYRVRLGEG